MKARNFMVLITLAMLAMIFPLRADPSAEAAILMTPMKAAANLGPTPDVLWLKMDVGTGTSAVDSSVAGNNGTLSGSTIPTWGTGPNANGCLTFNGSTAYVDCGSGSVPTAAVTFSCWVKYTTLVSQNQMMSKGYDGANSQTQLYLDASGKINWNTFNLSTGTHGVVGGTALSSGTWYFVCCFYDGTNWKIYLNAVLDGSAAAAGPVAAARKIEVGAIDTGSATPVQFWPGSIDDARIYGRALTPTEITTLYNAGAQ